MFVCPAVCVFVVEYDFFVWESLLGRTTGIVRAVKAERAEWRNPSRQGVISVKKGSGRCG